MRIELKDKKIKSSSQPLVKVTLKNISDRPQNLAQEAAEPFVDGSEFQSSLPFTSLGFHWEVFAPDGAAVPGPIDAEWQCKTEIAQPPTRAPVRELQPGEAITSTYFGVRDDCPTWTPTDASDSGFVQLIFSKFIQAGTYKVKLVYDTRDGIDDPGVPMPWWEGLVESNEASLVAEPCDPKSRGCLKMPW